MNNILNKKIIFVVFILIVFVPLFLLFLFNKKVCNNKYGCFQRVGDLNEARADHKSFLMNDGKAIIIGGHCLSRGLDQLRFSQEIYSIEVFDPISNSFRIVLKDIRLIDLCKQIIIPLFNDKLLLFSSSGEAFVFDYTLKQLISLGKTKQNNVYNSFITLKNNNILLFNGYKANKIGHRVDQDAVELFDPSSNKFSYLGNKPKLKDSELFLLPDGKFSIRNFHSNMPKLFLYNLEKDKIEKLYHAFNNDFSIEPKRLPNDELLLNIRSKDDFQLGTNYEIYNFRNNKSKHIGKTLLNNYSCDIEKPNNNLLIMLNCSCNYDLEDLEKCKNVEIYDSTQNIFGISDKQTNRNGSSTIVLKDGRVLVSGGYDTYWPILSTIDSENQYKTLKTAEVFVSNLVNNKEK